MDKRYKHILVPLDGSALAELALADAAAIIRAERRALPEAQPNFFTFWASLLKYASAVSKCPGSILSHSSTF